MLTELGLRETLIVAALQLLESDGGEPSLRAVARAAGVSAMAPYRHFPDKTGLLAAVASYGFDRLLAVLVAADDQTDPHQALYEQGLAFVNFALANPALFRLMYSHQYGNADGAAVRGTYDVLARRVAVVAPKQAIAVTLACRSLAQGLAAIALNNRLAPGESENIRTALRLFVDGLKKRAE